MPGILPMKVIKVGSNAQSRIAQACDRCRSKKIRCDGIRPSCTQCVNVGFECKTSDKLSRRAFPRGYTESLEERVRQLEGEIRELKDLLDEKDEKIDMLSRIHSHPSLGRPQSRKSSMASPPSDMQTSDEPAERDDTFKVEQTPLMLDDDARGSYFVGTSSGQALVDAFNQKAQEANRLPAQLAADVFFPAEPPASPSLQSQAPGWTVPPRLVSDQMVNIFFQEWAPLFPVLHRPSFLSLYERYVMNPEGVQDQISLAQLNLVFGIAALSNTASTSDDVRSFEVQWHKALEIILPENSLEALQCLILAQIYCMLRGDCGKLLTYKGMAISVSHRLGLHQSQKRFALSSLASETRKKVFWTLYALDCFSAAQLGLPQHLKEDDICCEYPADVDDEYITDKGFMPTLPGESTKLSSALALFSASRILAKVLAENYPASASQDFSLRKIVTLSDELDRWWNGLPSHLRLQFHQDKPSTSVISSRTPVLALAYEYIRSLIHRPAVCARLGDRASSSIMALATASKHMIQILQLLEERNLSFSLCFNKAGLVTIAGFGILFQTLSANRDGKLVKDSRRLTNAVSDMLERWAAPSAADFRQLCGALLSSSASPSLQQRPESRQGFSEDIPFTHDPFRTTPKQFRALPSRTSQTPVNKAPWSRDQETRRATIATLPTPDSPMTNPANNNSAVSLHSLHSEPAQSEPPRSPQTFHSSNVAQAQANGKKFDLSQTGTNLDYLPFPGDAVQQGRRQTVAGCQLSASSSMPPLQADPSHQHSRSMPQMLRKAETVPGTGPVNASDWERMLGSLDNGQTNIYDTIYGGGVPHDPTLADLSAFAASNNLHSSASGTGGMAPLMQNLDGNGSWDFVSAATAAAAVTAEANGHHGNVNGMWGFDGVSGSPPGRSVLSFSEESLTSGEEFPVDFSHGNKHEYRGLMMPETEVSMELGGLDGNFGL